MMARQVDRYRFAASIYFWARRRDLTDDERTTVERKLINWSLNFLAAPAIAGFRPPAGCPTKRPARSKTPNSVVQL